MHALSVEIHSHGPLKKHRELVSRQNIFCDMTKLACFQKRHPTGGQHWNICGLKSWLNSLVLLPNYFVGQSSLLRSKAAPIRLKTTKQPHWDKLPPIGVETQSCLRLTYCSVLFGVHLKKLWLRLQDDMVQVFVQKLNLSKCSALTLSSFIIFF